MKTPSCTRRGFLQMTLGAGMFSPVLLRAASATEGRLNPAIIGANTAISGTGLFEAIDILHSLKFQTIEIHPFGVPEPTPGVFPGFELDQLSAEQKQRLRTALKNFRHVTTHLPYSGLSYFARDQKLVDHARSKMTGALEATKYCGAELAVAHVTGPKGLSLKDAWPEIIRQFREWGDVAKRHKFRLAVETGYPASAKEFVQLIKEIDHAWVGCAIDVGHQIWYEEFKARAQGAERSTPAGIRAYNDLMHEIIDALAPKIFHFHVHDIDPSTWKEHKPIGLGVIDYPRLVKKLEAIRYQGLLVLEIGAPDMRAALSDNKRRLEGFLAG